MKKGNYIKGIGISYRGRIEIIKKSGEKLQAIFEAFTNSLEAISLLERKKNNAQIKIQLFFSYIKEELFENKKLEKIIIEDTGIGFNEENFNRLKNLDDNSKKFKNKGTGRIQFIQFFKEAEYESIYLYNKSYFKKRNFILSMSKEFLDENALILEKQNIKVDAKFSSTKLIMRELLDDKDIHSYYNNLDLIELKEKIVAHYLEYFCSHRENLPTIKLELYFNNELNEETKIELSDFPKIDKTENFNVNYSVIESDGKIEKIHNTEEFQIKAFKIDKKYKIKNAIKFTNKGETIEKIIKFDSLKHDEHIDEKNYLFLISGEYIDNKISDTRGILNIPKKSKFKEDFEKLLGRFDKEEIILNDIEDKANEIILKMYHEINERNNEKINRIKKLKNLFLLNDETIEYEKIKINDTEEKILENYYITDAKIRAKQDVNLKKQLEKIENLNPSKSEDYSKKLEKEVNELVKSIPLQNKTALAQYIARRKIVLELFDKILNRKLNFQIENKRNIDESLLHNLIFQQTSNDPKKSDLWLINEEFIYFKGISEARLCDVKINGQKVFRKELSEEENKHLRSNSKNRLKNRPDILLFPEEGKCIIIEFKTPNTDVSDHLHQIDKYASLIRNYTEKNINIKTFYGYFIGENFENKDILGIVGNWEESENLNYLFRPSATVRGFENNENGSIYTEVIKYSTLLERAKRRNLIFMEKLGLV